MNFKLEIEFSKADLLKEIDALKNQIDDMRPLPEDVEGKVMQKLRLDWNYNSNAIEGNKLSYGETAAFLSEGITAKGKPLKDHLDIKGHNEAIDFLLDIVKESRLISEADVRSLHKMILVESYEVRAQTTSGVPTTKRISLGEYKTSPNHVKTSTGELHYYATPEETPAKMQELMEWYAGASTDQQVHPIITAALFHHKFVAIHPFDDGNGRLSRILMNLIIMQKGYPPVVIKMDDRQNYYALLRRADVGEVWPFMEYILERLKSSLELYLKGAKGGDINEDEDIDKEIALFKMRINNEINLQKHKSNEVIEDLMNWQIAFLIDKLNSKAKEFKDLFFKHSFFIGFDTGDFVDVVHKSLGDFLIEGVNYRKNVLDKLKLISITYRFLNFKSSNNDFSVSGWLNVKFDEYHYRITNMDDEEIVAKLYHEELTKSEEQKVVKRFVSGLIELISKEQKSSES